MKLILGDELFKWQRVGGISRIYRSIIPIFREMAEVERVFLYHHEAGTLVQPAEKWVDGERGLWLDQRRRPYRLRCEINERVLSPINRLYLKSLTNAVYLPSYYSIPPIRMRSLCLVYDMIHERYPDSFEKTARDHELARKSAAIEGASRLLCISSTTKNDLVEFYGINPDICDVAYLGGGERKPIFQESSMSAADKITVLYVGDTHARYKNFRFLISALEHFALIAGDQLELHVVTSAQSAEQFEAQYGSTFEFRHIWHFNADDDLLNGLYRDVDVFVYPSLWEGFGIPIIEALSWGCPVVCSNIPVFHEIAENLVEFFDPASESDFSAAMQRALAAGRALDIVCARARHAEKFTWDKSAKAVFSSAMRCC